MEVYELTLLVIVIGIIGHIMNQIVEFQGSDGLNNFDGELLFIDPSYEEEFPLHVSEYHERFFKHEYG